ncbi:MAG TPA: amidohydrolase [Caldithrix abyssi]|uniref:Amidohydrolase n=1 Tax=Caldithrix abyssi TaxID=187145 RepID=A0A7V4U0K8_CALAY|nr:amidohydrolase [Caldithrix abyssi]
MRKIRQKRILAVVVTAVVVSFLLIVSSCTVKNRQAATIYKNGTILTMNDARPTAEAVAVRDGKIVAVGALAEVQKAAGGNAKTVDLNGKTLMPGFIDSHSHLSLMGTKLALANMSNPPAGPITSIEDIKNEFRKWIKENNLKPGDLVAGWGYDHTQLKEHRHPTRDDLDEISTEHPIVLIHFSTHQVVLNSLALEMVGYNENTPDPEGGRILRYPGTKKPNGIAQETASIPIKLKVFGATYEEKLKRITKALDKYMEEGFTTAQDAALLDTAWLAAYRHLGRDGVLKIDVAAMPFFKTADMLMKNFEQDKQYHNHFRLAGVKLILDGGSPGRSAYLREPYYVQEPGEKNFRGVPLFPNQDDIDRMVTSYYEKGWPTFIHALGDAAVDQAVHAVRTAENKFPGKDRRTQIIHAQLFWPDQMDALKQLGATVTFQMTHVYYFGDFHIKQTFGPERAEHLCPMKTAMDHGLNVTIHHDAPVHPPDQLFIIWSAVNRVTRSGHVLGPDERVSVMDALKASTINAAYQIFEEDLKGSIEPGKLADFVVLSDNPMTIDPMKIKDIEVLETIKEGETVFKR